MVFSPVLRARAGVCVLAKLTLQKIGLADTMLLLFEKKVAALRSVFLPCCMGGSGGAPVNSSGAVAKWLRRQFAKLLFPGSSPGGTSKLRFAAKRVIGPWC